MSSQLQMISMNEQQRIRELLTTNKRIELLPSPSSEDGTWWEIRQANTGGGFSLFINYEDGGTCLMHRFSDITAVCYWLSSDLNPAQSWEWK